MRPYVRPQIVLRFVETEGMVDCTLSSMVVSTVLACLLELYVLTLGAKDAQDGHSLIVKTIGDPKRRFARAAKDPHVCSANLLPHSRKDAQGFDCLFDPLYHKHGGGGVLVVNVGVDCG